MSQHHTDDEIDCLLAMGEEDEERAAIRRRVRRNKRLLRKAGVRCGGIDIRLDVDGDAGEHSLTFSVGLGQGPVSLRQIINALKHGEPV